MPEVRRIPQQDVKRAVKERVILSIPCALIRPNPKNPRKYIDPAALLRLQRDIASGQVSIALVKPINSTEHQFQLIAGERRWRACIEAGRPLDCEVRVYTDPEQELLDCWKENSNREDLQRMEYAALLAEAEKLKAIKKIKYAADQYKAIGQIFGRSDDWAKKHLALNSLVPEIQDELRQEDAKGERVIDINNAARLGSLPAESQRLLFEVIKGGGLSAKAAKRVIDRHINETGLAQHRRGTKPSDEFKIFERLLRRAQREVKEALEQATREPTRFDKMFSGRSTEEVRELVRQAADVTAYWNDLTERVKKVRFGLGAKTTTDVPEGSSAAAAS